MCALQVWNEEDAEDEVLGMVARTGLRTTVGRLLRQVMCPVHTIEPHKDTFVAVSCHRWPDLMRLFELPGLLELPGLFELQGLCQEPSGPNALSCLLTCAITVASVHRDLEQHQSW